MLFFASHQNLKALEKVLGVPLSVYVLFRTQNL